MKSQRLHMENMFHGGSLSGSQEPATSPYF